MRGGAGGGGGGGGGLGLSGINLTSSGTGHLIPE